MLLLAKRSAVKRRRRRRRRIKSFREYPRINFYFLFSEMVVSFGEPRGTMSSRSARLVINNEPTTAAAAA
jgi:hypothetical protein